MQIMEKNERIIAITRILPGLEVFLREVLANESLRPEAEIQRLDFVKKLEELTKPPSLPPRPTNLKTQCRASVDSIDSVENDDNDFASVQRKLSNIFYLRRDFDDLNEHFVNAYAADEANKGTIRKVPAKSSGKRLKTKEGIYEPLHRPGHETETDLEAVVLSEEESSRFYTRSLARGTHIRQSLSKGKWFARKEKSMLQEVYASDLLLPTISGHLMEVRTNKRRWCVLKDHHLYVFKTQEEPALFQIALSGCDISTVPRGDKTKVSYSFKITQDGVAAVILGIEEEKDLSAWMNALITASLSKTPLSPHSKISKTLPRSMHTPWSVEGVGEEGPVPGRRHTVGASSNITKESFFEIDSGTYEQPTDALGLHISLDTYNYNPPLPPLPGEVSVMLERNGQHARVRPLSKCSGIYEEVGDEFINKHSIDSYEDYSGDVIADGSKENANEVSGEPLNVVTNGRQAYSEAGTSDSEYSSDDDEHKDENGNYRLFHDRWAVHSGVLYQKKQTGWNKRYCKIVDNCLRGFRNPNDLTPVLELNLAASNVRIAEPEGKRRFIFQLNTAESESLYFNTDTQQSLERWIEVVSVAATSRGEHSLAVSEDELDAGVFVEPSTEKTPEDHCESRDSLSYPDVPERKESLRKSRVNEDNVQPDDKKCEDETESTLKGQNENPEKLIVENQAGEPVTSRKNKLKDPEEIWQRRDAYPHYATTPRTKPATKITKSASHKEFTKRLSNFPDHSLDSPQKAMQVSKKRKYSERLKKYLDKDGQFSGFILELRVKKNSTTLTRRWAVVQNGFFRIYENYGCAAPFLRISLVEAFLKDFSNVAKARFCFMLEYGARQSILFQTNTHQELKRWINVITLTIASHTDLFGSQWDLNHRERKRDEDVNGMRSLNSPIMPSKSQSQIEADTPDSAAPGKLLNPERISTCTKSEEYHVEKEDTYTPEIPPEAVCLKPYSICSSCSDDVTSTNGNESCTSRASLALKVKFRGYLWVFRKVYRKSVRHEFADVGAVDSCEDTARAPCENDALLYLENKPPASCNSETVESDECDTRASLTTGARGSREGSVLEFCELKGSLFSIYDNEKSEESKQVFNLLYDKFREVADVPLAFTLTSDRVGCVQFECETEQNFETWKQVISNTALQDSSSSDVEANYSGKCSNDSPLLRKRYSLKASYAEEEAKHHEVLRSLALDETNCDHSRYSCHVYEVRDSSGNKTIIRRWCVVDGDLIRVFERETSREAVAELRPSAFRLKDIENPRSFPFAFKLQRLLPQEGEDEFLVIQASNAKDFRELLLRIRSVQTTGRSLAFSKSESNLNVIKKPPLTPSKSDLSLKRILALARRTSKDNLIDDANAPSHDTWPKVVRRERKSSRRALSDTSTDRPVTNSLTEEKGEVRNSMGYFLFDSEGKFSGYLIEVRNSALCRSEVRKWCVVQDEKFSIFDDKNSKVPNRVIDLGRDVQLADLSHVHPKNFEIRVTSGAAQCHVYRAREDFQKWLTVLAQAIDMCQKREHVSENGSLEGRSLEGKRSWWKYHRGSSSQGFISEGPNSKQKCDRKDSPTQKTPGTAHVEDTAF